MFSRSTPEPLPVPANAETRFSLPELRKLHKQLVENKRVNDANENLVVEILRVIAEMVVYGDNKSEMLFDFFCEKNMLSLFLEIMNTPGGCPSIVHIQILQTLSILISCVRNDTSLYYLLSNNYVNDIINYPHDFMNDESLCAQFASFMKTLSLKLNIHTVQFFFIEETGAFPILTRAVELLTIPDPMIRIASQSTILNVYRVEDSRARAYALQDEVMGIMFAQTVNFMENQYHTIFKTCKLYYKTCNSNDEAASTKLESKIDDILSAMEDWFYYLQDLLDLDVPVLRKALVHQLIHDFLLPVLLGPLLKHHSVFEEEEKSKQRAQRGRLHSGHDYAFKSEERASDRGRLSLVLDDVQFEIYDNIELIASLSYMLQMLKIVTHPALQRSVLVTIFHPLSLDCRMQLLKEMEGSGSIGGSVHGVSGGSGGAGGGSGVNGTSNGNIGGIATIANGDTPAKEAHSSATTPDTTNTTTTNPTTYTTPLTPNHIKLAWDRLHVSDCQKVTLLMMYVEHILLERIVSTAVDCFPGNDGVIEVDEEYLTTNHPAITPLRSVSDPRADAISMLQWLYLLPSREYCGAYVTSAAITRSLHIASLPSTPTVAVRKAIDTTPITTGNDHVWSSALDTTDTNETDESSEVTINLNTEFTTDTTTNATNPTNNTTATNGTTDIDQNNSASVSFKTAHNASSDSLDGLALPTTLPTLPSSTSDTALDTLHASQPHTFVSPLKSRTKLGRNDMLLPVESTMGKGLNSADQLMLSALRRLDEVVLERAVYYPEVKVQYSVDPMFAVLGDASAYSVTTIQVAAHAVYSLALLIASTRPLQSPAPRASFSSLARTSLSLLSSGVSNVVGGVSSVGSGSVAGMGIVRVSSSTKSGSNNNSKPTSKANSFSEPLPHPLPQSAYTTAVEHAARLRADQNQVLLDYCFVRVREAARNAAMKLLVRIEGTMPEMLLNVVREEVARSEGQKWRRCIERMYQDVLLFLPNTQFSAERMGLDFAVPVSQVETIRKEVQAFILLRALHRQLQAINSTSLPTSEADNADNLYGSITDKSFLTLEEKNLLSANITAPGSAFDMRGKRFLEVRLIPVQARASVDGGSGGSSGSGSAHGTPDASRTHSPTRNSGSMWGINTKRLFGSSSSSTTANATSIQSSPATPVPAVQDPIMQMVASKKKILFVQDNKHLFIVSCDKADSRSGFKVLIAAPLLYTDAQVDPSDPLRFKVIVRTSRTMEYMYPCEPDMTQLLREGGTDLLASSAAAGGAGNGGGGGEGTPTGKNASIPKVASNSAFPMHTKYTAPKLESSKFLKARGKTSFWTLTVRVENDHACKLAVQHIENKRKEQAAAKVGVLQQILEHWGSELDVGVNEH